MENKNIPPTDGKHYWFNEETEVWLEVALDSNGLALTPERILQLKPYHSWVRNEDNTAWVPPVPRPDDILNANGHPETVFAWDEESVSWIEQSLKPYPSWVTNDDGVFVPPTQKPDDVNSYIWNEKHEKWIKDPYSFEEGEAFWDDEIKDFISILDKLGFIRTKSGIDARFKEQEWPSWVQDEDGMWRAPLQYPSTGGYSYVWDEYEQEWFNPVPELSDMVPPHLRINTKGEINESTTGQ